MPTSSCLFTACFSSRKLLLASVGVSPGRAAARAVAATGDGVAERLVAGVPVSRCSAPKCEGMNLARQGQLLML
ncbi:hypothetical protein D3C84_1020290 [compost metagenome]